LAEHFASLQAIRQASVEELLEVEDVGSIEVGKVADLVFVDDKFNVKQVMLEGEICKF